MSQNKTLSLRAVIGSHVDPEGSKITISGPSATGATARINMTTETAAALVAGLVAASREANKIREANGKGPVDGVDTWLVERAIVTFPTRDKAQLELRSGGVKHVFELRIQEAVTLGQDLNTVAAGRVSKSHPTVLRNETIGPEIYPTVMTLPLATEPISTASMTDYPDGLAVEMRIDSQTDDGSFGRIRIPMFADTARSLIEALRQRLSRLDEGSKSKDRKPS